MGSIADMGSLQQVNEQFLGYVWLGAKFCSPKFTLFFKKKFTVNVTIS